MSFCPDYSLPTYGYPQPCLNINRGSSLCRFLFKKCDFTIDLCSDDDVEVALMSCYLKPSPMIRGSLNENTTKRKGMRCEGSSVINSIKTIQFEDANNQLGNFNYDWWNLFAKRSREWKVGYFADDQFFGWFNFTLHVQEPIANIPTTIRRKIGEMEINYLRMFKPLRYSENILPLIAQYQSWDCSQEDFLVDTSFECLL